MTSSSARIPSLSFRSSNSSSLWPLSNIFRLAWGSPPTTDNNNNINNNNTTNNRPRRRKSIATTTRTTTTTTNSSSSTISSSTININTTTPPSLTVVRVKGDGRCLYRSIARSLASEEGRVLTSTLETEDADALRDLAYQYVTMRDTAEEYVRKHIVEGNFKKYTDAMRNKSFFAGEAEILALSNALRIPIAVYLNTNRPDSKGLRNIATYGEKFKPCAKTIRVLYNGSNHFNAVIAKSCS